MKSRCKKERTLELWLTSLYVPYIMALVFTTVPEVLLLFKLEGTSPRHRRDS